MDSGCERFAESRRRADEELTLQDPMYLHLNHLHALTRRQFLSGAGRLSLGAIALQSFIGHAAKALEADRSTANPLGPRPSTFPAKAKAVIYLSMSGAPPQHDLFDWKPELKAHHMKDCPEKFLQGEKFAFIKGTPKLLGSPYNFAQHGNSGAWVSEMLPHFSRIADEVTLIRSVNTDQFNHAPAELFMYTGSPRNGAASMGSWVTYGL